MKHSEVLKSLLFLFLAFAIFSCDLEDEDDDGNDDEPSLYSVHGTADTIVAYTSGPADGTPVVLFGSSSIHTRANETGIASELLAITDGRHDAPINFSCGSCNVRLLGFLYSQLQ